MEPEIRQAPPVDHEARRRQALEWVPLVASLLAFSINLQASYVLVPPACGAGTRTLVGAVHVVSLLLALAGGALAWRLWSAAGREWPDDEAGARSRSRFLAVVGLLACAFTSFVVVAQSVPTFVLSPCQ